MRIAIANGQIYLIEMTPTQLSIIRSWGLMKYDRKKQQAVGLLSLELLEKVKKVNDDRLPPHATEVYRKLKETRHAVDKLRTVKDVPYLVDFPVKGSLYQHQERAAEMALVEFGLLDPKEVLGKEKRSDAR